MEFFGKKDYLSIFKDAKVGLVIGIPISFITPTQPDDQRPPEAKRPIEACFNRGSILIVHGNHRYWELKRRSKQGNSKIQVRKVKDYYSGI